MKLSVIKIPPEKIRPALLIFFFVSGACGLIYEIAWLRVMGLIFGNTTLATSTILASYMAGLGLGALYFGRKIDTHGQPVRFYGWLEGGVAVYAFLTPLIWKLIELIHIGFYRVFHPSFMVFSLFKFVIVFIALILPTFLMGGTLPVISKYFIHKHRETGRFVALLYALNTFGAVVGVFLAGFYLLYTAGVWQTVCLAGVFNLVIFAACFGYVADERETEEMEAADTAAGKIQTGTPVPPVTHGSGYFKSLLILFGLSGAVSMMYEVGWTRVLAITLGSSVYGFSVMLITFLLGISLGSYFFSWASRFIRPTLTVFAVLQILTAGFALLGFNLFNDMPYYFVVLYSKFGHSEWAVDFAKFLLCGIVMFFPTLCIGALFACFVHIYQQTEALGTEVGTAYFANTIGTIAGSALTGFAVIPLIGIQKTLLLASGINVAVGVAAFFMTREKFNRRRLTAAGLAVLFLCVSAVRVQAWDNIMITSGTAVKPDQAVGMSLREFKNSLKDRRVLFYKEGLSATVSVAKIKDKVSLAVNGKVDASNDDAFTQYLLGHLPLLFYPDAKKVMVIGFGSGSTMAAVAAHPVEVIHGVELEEAVIQAAGYFEELNRNILKDPRVKMFINDGRNALLVSPEKYDVIISEPSNPWIAGVANLFSREHYRNMYKRLTDRGIACQWLHAYSMSNDDLRMIIRTFTEEFDHVSLWTSYYPDMMLLGSKQPLVIDMERLRQEFAIPQVRKDLEPHGILSPEGLFASYWLGDKELRRMGKGARINSDDHPYLEFSAPRSLYRNTLQENYEDVNKFKDWTWPVIHGLSPPVEENSDFFVEVARGYIAKRMMREAQLALERADQIVPGNPAYYEVMGILNYESGRFEQAALNFNLALQAGRDTAELNYYTGMALAKLGKPEQAIVELNRAVGMDDQNAKYLTGLADTLYGANQLQIALKVYDRIFKLKGSDFHAIDRMADIIFQLAPLQQQIAISEVMMTHYPKYFPAYERLGQALEANGYLDKAEEIYKQMEKIFPEQPKTYLLLGNLYYRMNRLKEMKASIKRARALEPSLKKNPQIERLMKL